MIMGVLKGNSNEGRNYYTGDLDGNIRQVCGIIMFSVCYETEIMLCFYRG